MWAARLSIRHTGVTRVDTPRHVERVHRHVQTDCPNRVLPSQTASGDASLLGHLEPWRFVGALQGFAGVIGLSVPFGNAELSAVNNVRAKA
jgi:hypothetical protein